jgi:DNA-binding transcriptional MerR regulator
LKITREELIQKLAISENELNTWIEHKLLTPASEGGIYFPNYALLYGEAIKKFLAMGYSYKEIGKIKNEIGLPIKDGKQKILTRAQLLTIGELAEQGEVNTRTIKFWEEKGLINPFQRSEGGFRLYRVQDVLRVKFIKDLQMFNYTLAEIGSIIKLAGNEYDYGNILSEVFSIEELEKTASGLEYLIEYMKETRKATYRVEAIFSKRLKAILKLIKQKRNVQ